MYRDEQGRLRNDDGTLAEERDYPQAQADEPTPVTYYGPTPSQWAPVEAGRMPEGSGVRTLRGNVEGYDQFPQPIDMSAQQNYPAFVRQDRQLMQPEQANATLHGLAESPSGDTTGLAPETRRILSGIAQNSLTNEERSDLNRYRDGLTRVEKDFTSGIIDKPTFDRYRQILQSRMVGSAQKAHALQELQLMQQFHMRDQVASQQMLHNRNAMLNLGGGKPILSNDDTLMLNNDGAWVAAPPNRQQMAEERHDQAIDRVIQQVETQMDHELADITNPPSWRTDRAGEAERRVRQRMQIRDRVLGRSGGAPTDGASHEGQRTEVLTVPAANSSQYRIMTQAIDELEARSRANLPQLGLLHGADQRVNPVRARMNEERVNTARAAMEADITSARRILAAAAGRQMTAEEESQYRTILGRLRQLGIRPIRPGEANPSRHVTDYAPIGG